MTLTLQDMRDVLKGQGRSTEAIFWFCLFWNSGPQSDLYRVMCETNYDPHFYEFKHKPGGSPSEFLSPGTDPEILFAHAVLREHYERAYGPLREYPLRPIRFGTLKENDVVIHGPGRVFACIPAEWPCRVFLVGGELAVPCAEDRTGRAHHRFEMLPDGSIKGFRR